jgi:integrase
MGSTRRKRGAFMGVQVREKPPGSGVWWVFINHNGKRKAKRVGKEETALKVAEKMQAKLVLGELDLSKKDSQCPTLKEYAEMWLSLPHDWKQSTRESYKDNFNLHVYPVLGKHRLDEIKRKDLKAFLDGLLSKGLNPATVNLVRAPLSGLLSHAVDSELIESNPLRELRTKNKGKALEIEPLTEKETALLLEKAKEHLKGFYYPSILCALRTGLRIGELQALQWRDIDFSGRFIEVRRSWRKNRITDTKNKKRRRVDMTPHLVETLKALRVAQKKKALKEGRPVSEWVFDNGKGEMLNRVIFTKAVKKCLDLAKLREIRVHDLRHTYATIRLLRGHNVGDVSYQLGHSSIKITYDTYCHWIPGKFKSEVDELDTLQPGATYTQPEDPASQIPQAIQEPTR